jgi:uncharacterized membrane protein
LRSKGKFCRFLIALTYTGLVIAYGVSDNIARGNWVTGVFFLIGFASLFVAIESRN